MNTIRIRYTGERPYRDRTVLRTLWQAGDVLEIPVAAARQLLKFREFEHVTDDAAPNPESTQVREAFEATQKQQDQEVENILLDVESWDKDQLAAYAGRYEIVLNRRKSVANLRSEVATLVEQYGVR